MSSRWRREKRASRHSAVPMHQSRTQIRVNLERQITADLGASAPGIVDAKGMYSSGSNLTLGALDGPRR